MVKGYGPGRRRRGASSGVPNASVSPPPIAESAQSKRASSRTSTRRRRGSNRSAHGTSLAAKEGHESEATALDAGVRLLQGIVDTIRSGGPHMNTDSETKTGERSSQMDARKRDFKSAEVISVMSEVIDERSRVSLEYTLGVLGVSELPSGLEERQRSLGAQAFVSGFRNRAIRRKRDAVLRNKLLERCKSDGDRKISEEAVEGTGNEANRDDKPASENLNGDELVGQTEGTSPLPNEVQRSEVAANSLQRNASDERNALHGASDQENGDKEKGSVPSEAGQGADTVNENQERDVEGMSGREDRNLLQQQEGNEPGAGPCQDRLEEKEISGMTLERTSQVAELTRKLDAIGKIVEAQTDDIAPARAFARVRGRAARKSATKSRFGPQPAVLAVKANVDDNGAPIPGEKKLERTKKDPSSSCDAPRSDVAKATLLPTTEDQITKPSSIIPTGPVQMDCSQEERANMVEKPPVSTKKIGLNASPPASSSTAQKHVPASTPPVVLQTSAATPAEEVATEKSVGRAHASSLNPDKKRDSVLNVSTGSNPKTDASDGACAPTSGDAMMEDVSSGKSPPDHSAPHVASIFPSVTDGKKDGGAASDLGPERSIAPARPPLNKSGVEYLEGSGDMHDGIQAETGKAGLDTTLPSKEVSANCVGAKTAQSLTRAPVKISAAADSEQKAGSATGTDVGERATPHAQNAGSASKIVPSRKVGQQTSSKVGRTQPRIAIDKTIPNKNPKPTGSVKGRTVVRKLANPDQTDSAKGASAAKTVPSKSVGSMKRATPVQPKATTVSKGSVRLPASKRPVTSIRLASRKGVVRRMVIPSVEAGPAVRPVLKPVGPAKLVSSVEPKDRNVALAERDGEAARRPPVVKKSKLSDLNQKKVSSDNGAKMHIRSAARGVTKAETRVDVSSTKSVVGAKNGSDVIARSDGDEECGTRAQGSHKNSPGESLRVQSKPESGSDNIPDSRDDADQLRPGAVNSMAMVNTGTPSTGVKNSKSHLPTEVSSATRAASSKPSAMPRGASRQNPISKFSSATDSRDIPAMSTTEKLGTPLTLASGSSMKGGTVGKTRNNVSQRNKNLSTGSQGRTDSLPGVSKTGRAVSKGKRLERGKGKTVSKGSVVNSTKVSSRSVALPSMEKSDVKEAAESRSASAVKSTGRSSAPCVKSGSSDVSIHKTGIRKGTPSVLEGKEHVDAMLSADGVRGGATKPKVHGKMEGADLAMLHKGSSSRDGKSPRTGSPAVVNTKRAVRTSKPVPPGSAGHVVTGKGTVTTPVAGTSSTAAAAKVPGQDQMEVSVSQHLPVQKGVVLPKKSTVVVSEKASTEKPVKENGTGSRTQSRAHQLGKSVVHGKSYSAGDVSVQSKHSHFAHISKEPNQNSARNPSASNHEASGVRSTGANDVSMRKEKIEPVISSQVDTVDCAPVDDGPVKSETEKRKGKESSSDVEATSTLKNESTNIMNTLPSRSYPSSSVPPLESEDVPDQMIAGHPSTPQINDKVATGVRPTRPSAAFHSGATELGEDRAMKVQENQEGRSGKPNMTGDNTKGDPRNAGVLTRRNEASKKSSGLTTSRAAEFVGPVANNVPRDKGVKELDGGGTSKSVGIPPRRKGDKRESTAAGSRSSKLDLVTKEQVTTYDGPVSIFTTKFQDSKRPGPHADPATRVRKKDDRIAEKKAAAGSTLGSHASQGGSSRFEVANSDLNDSFVKAEGNVRQMEHPSGPPQVDGKLPAKNFLPPAPKQALGKEHGLETKKERHHSDPPESGVNEKDEIVGSSQLKKSLAGTSEDQPKANNLALKNKPGRSGRLPMTSESCRPVEKTDRESAGGNTKNNVVEEKDSREKSPSQGADLTTAATAFGFSRPADEEEGSIVGEKDLEAIFGANETTSKDDSELNPIGKRNTEDSTFDVSGMRAETADSGVMEEVREEVAESVAVSEPKTDEVRKGKATRNKMDKTATGKRTERRISSRRSMGWAGNVDDGMEKGAPHRRLRRESVNLRDAWAVVPGDLIFGDDLLMHECVNVWATVNRAKISIPFREPVLAKHAPGYFEIVKHPMDLSTVRKNLEKKVVDNPRKFYDQMMLICRNALLYNDVESDLYGLAIELKQMIRKYTKPIVRRWLSERRREGNAASSESSLSSSSSDNDVNVPEPASSSQRPQIAQIHTQRRVYERSDSDDDGDDEVEEEERPRPSQARRGRGGARRRRTSNVGRAGGTRIPRRRGPSRADNQSRDNGEDTVSVGGGGGPTGTTTVGRGRGGRRGGRGGRRGGATAAGASSAAAGVGGGDRNTSQARRGKRPRSGGVSQGGAGSAVAAASSAADNDEEEENRLPSRKRRRTLSRRRRASEQE